MKNKVILLSGATGVGTSKFGMELAKALNIHNIQGTDSAREIIRSIINENINPALNSSTYLAGQTKNYENKSEDSKRTEILRAYKNQCASVNVAINGILQRTHNENSSIIIEGIHLIPGKISNENKTKEIHLYISDSKTHEQRFIQRQKEAPGRQMEKYLVNFKEIRWIHDYLFERAKQYDNIHLIDNSGSIDNTLEYLLDTLY